MPFLLGKYYFVLGNYLENKLKHNVFLKDNPLGAKKKFINIY